MHYLTKHLPHHFSLIGIIAAGFLGLLFFSYDKGFQSAIVIATSTSFVVWGIVHHHIHDDLHPKVVLEYIATAVFGAVILLAVIWR